MNLNEFVEKVELKGGNFKNIADLGAIENKEMLKLREEETEINGKLSNLAKFDIVRDGSTFEVNLPWNVIKSMKEYSKRGFTWTKFTVAKSVEGGRNKYTFMPLDPLQTKPVVEDVQ